MFRAAGLAQLVTLVGLVGAVPGGLRVEPFGQQACGVLTTPGAGDRGQFARLNGRAATLIDESRAGRYEPPCEADAGGVRLVNVESNEHQRWQARKARIGELNRVRLIGTVRHSQAVLSTSLCLDFDREFEFREILLA